MAKLPYLQFYVDDWLSDEKARLCSLSARGLWIDMLCLMHKSDRRGYLQQASGHPYSHEQLARMTGCSADEVARLLQELSTSGTASVSDHGVYFSRRMARDEKIRKIRSKSGRKGGKKSAELKGYIPQLVEEEQLNGGFLLEQNPSKTQAKGQAKAKQNSGSGSVLNSEGGARGKPPDEIRSEIPTSLDSPEFRDSWDRWKQHRREIKKKLTPLSIKQQMIQFEKWGISRAITAIDHTIRMGWVGIREPEPEKSPGKTLFPNQQQLPDYAAIDAKLLADRAESDKQRACASKLKLSALLIDRNVAPRADRGIT